MAGSTHRARLRPLGSIEQYSAARGHLGIYHNVCVTAEYHRDGNEPLRPIIYSALATVISKHPILSVTIVDVDKDPYFVRLDHVDLDRCVVFGHHEHVFSENGFSPALDGILEQQHDQPFTSNHLSTPFWRIIVLEDEKSPSKFLLSFVFHHSIADTKSALVFHQDLEYALGLRSESHTGHLVPTSREELLPSLDTIHEIHASPEYLQRLASLGDPPDEAWSGGLQILPVKTRISSAWIPANVLQSLRQRCKQEDLTLTPVLMSIIAQAFFDVLPSNYSFLQGDCALSLRYALPPPITSQSIGVYVSVVGETYQGRAHSIWDEARRTKTTIEKGLHSTGNDTSLAALKDVPDILQWLNNKLGKRRWAAWELSNVGVLEQQKAGETGNYKIGNVLFSQSAGACSAAVKISAATGRTGNMGFVFSWQEGVVDEELVRRLSERISQLIEAK